VEAQATDRAYRIGQQQNVQVHRLIKRATFEKRINDMIDAKRELAELTVGSGEQWIGHLGVESWRRCSALSGSEAKQAQAQQRHTRGNMNAALGALG
jgi:SNF2 family DNA or RNA helicase